MSDWDKLGYLVLTLLYKEFTATSFQYKYIGGEHTFRIKAYWYDYLVNYINMPSMLTCVSESTCGCGFC